MYFFDLFNYITCSSDYALSNEMISEWFERTWMEAVLAGCDVLPWHLPQVTEYNLEELSW
jgi:hypothetical protein